MPVKTTKPKTAKKRPVPKNRNELRPVDRAFIHAVMFELGVLPIEDPVLDMRRPLKALSADEARVIKRKFRKLWRKAMRREVGRGKNSAQRSSALGNKLGVGKHVPSRTERLERKRLVFAQLWNDYIVPMLQRFENPENPKQEAPPLQV